MTFPISMRAAVILDALAPPITAAVLAAAARLLPNEAGHSTGRRAGKDSESWISPSWLTRLGNLAAKRYNQVTPNEG